MRKRLYTDREKWCPRCRKWRPLREFGESAYHPSGRKSRCRDCSKKFDAIYVKRYRQGMTDEEFASLWERQERSCAVCREPLPLQDRRACHADLDPATRVPRGLLCTRCREVLMKTKNNQALLAQLISYLRCFEAKRKEGRC
jgi:hypothetical protein